MMITLGGIVILLISFVYYKYHQIKTYWAKKGVPHVKPLPLLGNMSLSTTEDFLKNMYNAHPNKRYVGFHHFHQPTLLIRDPELIKTILVRELASFFEHSTFTRGIGERYKSFYNFSMAEGWKDIRSIVTPIFTNSKLRSMFKLVEEHADVFVNHFQVDRPVEVDLKDAFSKYTNDAIVATLFGVNCDSFADKNNLLYVTGKKLADYSGLKGLSIFAYNISPFLTKILNVKMVPNEVGQVFEDLIEQVLKERTELGIVRPDALQSLMEAKNKPDTGGRILTNKDVTATIITLYFGSFDTTSTMSTLIAYALAVYPNVQKKAREEVDETMARCNAQLTFDDVTNMVYLEMVIAETLRKWPVSFLDRLCLKPFVIEPVNDDEKPVTVDPGTSVWFSINGLHHDSKYFENPDEFDPEKFNQENKSKHIPYTYVPFGAGPKICPGSKYVVFVMKLIFAKILHNFELVPCEKTPKSITPGFGFFVPPKGGLRITFKPRRK